MTGINRLRRTRINPLRMTRINPKPSTGAKADASPLVSRHSGLIAVTVVAAVGAVGRFGLRDGTGKMASSEDPLPGSMVSVIPITAGATAAM